MSTSASERLRKLLAESKRQLEEARKENTCDACGGTGVPVSLAQCMCAGTGKMSRAAVTLREELVAARKECSDFETRWLSLHGELWEGVKAHGLTAPSKGNDGERLIHAYCGGIVTVRNELEEARQELDKARIREAVLIKRGNEYADEVLRLAGELEQLSQRGVK